MCSNDLPIPEFDPCGNKNRVRIEFVSSPALEGWAFQMWKERNVESEEDFQLRTVFTSFKPKEDRDKKLAIALEEENYEFAARLRDLKL